LPQTGDQCVNSGQRYGGFLMRTTGRRRTAGNRTRNPSKLKQGELRRVFRLGRRAGRWPAIFLVLTLALAIIYRYDPSREAPRWRWITWGSAIAALLWLAPQRPGRRCGRSAPRAWTNSAWSRSLNFSKMPRARSMAAGAIDVSTLSSMDSPLSGHPRAPLDSSRSVRPVAGAPPGTSDHF
jgi:hypothetical protein